MNKENELIINSLRKIIFEAKLKGLNYTRIALKKEHFNKMNGIKSYNYGFGQIDFITSVNDKNYLIDVSKQNLNGSWDKAESFLLAQEAIKEFII